MSRVWSAIESHSATAHPFSLNLEIRDLQRQYPAELGTAVPHPRLKSVWKALINSIAEAEMTRWTGDQVSGGGRVFAYCQISLQHAQHVRSRGMPAYSWIPYNSGIRQSGLTPSILHYNWFCDHIR